jgi:beta-N-acetylglucosaminidase
MDNTQNNESQDKQTQRAADSPLKKPETETAHANTGDVAAAAKSNQAGPRQYEETRNAPKDEGGPISELNITRHAIDVLNDDTLDDTVDADAKNRDASQDEFLIEENPNAFVGVNASLVNSHFEQGDGLGGFDSRPVRNGLALKLESGFSVVDKGMIAPDAEEVERQYDFVDRDARGDTLRGRKHYAVNHVRPSRLIEIQRRDKS